MNIEILTTSLLPVPGKTYQQLEINYKDLTTGKISVKKLMPFGGNKASFDILKSATVGSKYTVTATKNEQGYIDWVNAVPYVAPAGLPAPTTSKSTYETPEERAKKQVYIIRQSSISTAATIITAGVKPGTEVNIQAVFDLAENIFTWVMQDPAKKLGSLEELPNDLDVL